MKRLLTLAATAVALVSNAWAQTPAPEVWARVGIFGGFNVNLHAAGFDELPGVPNCCPEFSSGSGVGASAGVLLEHLVGDRLELALRLGIEGRGATLDATESMPIVHNGERFDAEVRHVIEASLPSLFIEPLVAMRFGRFRLQAGPHFGFPLSGTYEQREELVKPEEFGTFENDRRVRNEASGDIPALNGFDAGITLGASYDLPLDRAGRMLASPEISFLLDLNSVAEQIAWSAHALRFGVALRYQLVRGPRPIAIEPERRDTTAPVAARASIRALAVRDDGSEREDVTVSVEEFISTNMRPLLNYVFFEEGSATLPSRYVRAETSRFDVARLHSLDAISTYHHLLDIVGQRLRAAPRARLTLVGANAASGSDSSLALSRVRALAVRDYLRDAWAIDTSRMRIETRRLPSVPSDTSTADGRAENRRVELLADDPSVLAPVVTIDTLRSVTPPLVRFRGESTLPSPSTWRVAVTQKGRPIRTFEGAGAVPAAIDWSTNADQLAVPTLGDSLQYALEVRSAAGGIVRAEEAMAVSVVTLRRKQEERIGDRIIDRYSLILFDFDRAGLDEANTRTVAAIRAGISPDATISVTGFTDRIGEEAYNERLATERARNVARLLGAPPERVSGVGERTLLYDNDLPEGRFYSRTVTIVVETPVAR